MGLVDEAYPHPYPGFSRQSFQALEKRLIDWRWRLKEYAHRLSATHGDFHPWNVMVRRDGDFSVLDRSRGEWGEPADDLATMALNYLLFGILESGDCRQFGGAFGKLYDAYFDAYLLASADQEILEVMAPYFVFRCLVVASPQWYPSHPEPVRQGLFRFMENVLQDRVFDWRRPLRYME
jgi:Ser/Thr protein kinase RdoA (MazF antagonist)